MRSKVLDQQYWLSRAAEERAEAQALISAEARRQAIKMAAIYDRLAEHYGNRRTAAKTANASPDLFLALWNEEGP
jgi:hypothetical protein